MRVGALQTMKTLKIIERLDVSSWTSLTVIEEESIANSFETM